MAFLLLAACSKPQKVEEEAKPVAQVRTATIESAAMRETVTAYGAAEFAPGAERTLASPGEAVVQQVLVSPGSSVVAGQSMVVLAPSPQAQVDIRKAAQDATTAAQATARAVRLRGDGLASNADVETARAASVTSSATLAGLRARGAGMTVRSPLSGVVETLTAAPGDLVAVGASLGKVGATQALRIRLGIEPGAAARLRPGARVILSSSGGGETFQSVLLSIDPRADPQTRLAGAIVQNPAGRAFAPGQPLRGEVVTHEVSGPVAPRSAVYYDQDQPYVLVVQGGAAHRKDVKLGVQQDERVQIAEGVSPGERIVIEGGASLEDGAKVKESGAPASRDEAKTKGDAS